jgi:hypothetical protein
MPSINEFLHFVLVPALVCGALLAAVWMSRASGVGKSLARRHLQALAFAAGMWIGYHAIVGLPVLPSENRQLAALDWMPWLVLAALAVSLVQSTSAGRRVPGWAWSALVCALVVVLSFLGRISSDPRWLAFTLMAATLFALWQSTDALARKLPGPAVPVVLWVVVTATSVATVLSHSAKIAQLAGTLAACLGACIVVALWNPLLSAAGGCVAIALTVLGVCWINAVHYADLTPLAAVLLMAALVTPWCAQLFRIDAWSRTKRVFVCALLAALPAAAAVVVAHLSAPTYEY